MNSVMNNEPISRRALIKYTVAGFAGLGLIQESSAADYGPFKMALQSYSLRHFLKTDDFVREAAKLKLSYAELYRGHLKTDAFPSEIETVKKKLAAVGIRVRAFGVEGFTSDHAKNEGLFKFGKALGLESLSADPQKDAFASLEKLVKTYNIKIAIHNHGPEDKRWKKPEWILDAVKGLDARIGSCADLGHFIRADIDPVAALEMLGSRVHGCHFKDFDKQGKDVVVGTGQLDVVKALRMLKKIGFKGLLSLEYEGDQENPIPKMQECLKTIREAVKRI
jgi:sugar phosphate isomerase/epimerase